LRDVLEARIRERAEEIVGTASVLLEERLRDAAPVGSPDPESGHQPGHLRDSISVSSPHPGEGGPAVSALAAAEYASFANDGSDPHVIEPRNAKVLRFHIPGVGIVYARRVQHPGTQPTNFWDLTVAQWGDILRQAQL
jgi:hypothetical protein